MTDEIDILKRALRDAPAPPPGREAKARAMAAAMAAYDAEIETAAQGSAEALRQRDRQSGLVSLFRRLRMTMTFPSLRTAMMGGASLAVIALAVVTTTDLQRKDGPGVGTLSLNQPTDDYAKTEGGPTQSQATGLADGEQPVVDAPVATRTLPFPQPATQESAGAPAPTGAARPPAPPPAEIRRLAGQPGAGGAHKRAEAKPAIAAEPVPLAETEADERERGVIGDDLDQLSATAGEQGRDRFQDWVPNPIEVTAENPVSTFSIDVDTASYSFMRSSLMQGVLPQSNAVRIEELVNYFPYDYPAPESRETPFRADVAIMPTPWNEGTRLMRIGIKGYELAPAEKPRSNLVFLLDTSGSMNEPNKLPLLINSFRLLVESLDADDTVSIVVYAGSAGTVLEPTKVADKGRILAALERLSAGGSTAGGEGIRQAYRLAEQNFDKDGVNRVILATDGDFNVGISSTEELESFIERQRETGIYLSVLGFGRGNYNDELMQALAQNGNGSAAYIDTLSEARKTLVDEAGSTLFPIAKDVKIQVEFNPATVAEYRLIGYETRQLRREDFNNDRIDAGEIGSGHTVTALYEITPVGSEARQVDDLRYAPATATDGPADEYAFVKIRYKAPDADESQLITTPVTGAAEIEPGDDARFAAAVAGFGQLLKGGRHTGDWSWDDAIALADGARGADPYGYRTEFVTLARLAKSAAALEPQRR